MSRQMGPVTAADLRPGNYIKLVDSNGDLFTLNQKDAKSLARYITYFAEHGCWPELRSPLWAGHRSQMPTNCTKSVQQPTIDPV